MLQNEKKSTRSRTVIQYKKRKPIFFYTHMITQDTRTITDGTRIFQQDWRVNNNFDTIVS